MALSKLERRRRIKFRVRKNIRGTKDKPRISVFRSNKHISIQAIDDIKNVTLLSISSRIKEIDDKKDINKTETAKMVGEKFAEMAKKEGIKEGVFDRNGFRYHGRVKALADAIRKGGLKI